jgi:hypothetical protein
MMETIIAVGVGVVVGGGILTLVYRILTGDREQRRLDEDLARFMPAEASEQARDNKAKKG